MGLQVTQFTFTDDLLLTRSNLRDVHAVGSMSPHRGINKAACGGKLLLRTPFHGYFFALLKPRYHCFSFHGWFNPSLAPTCPTPFNPIDLIPELSVENPVVLASYSETNCITLSIN